MSIEAPVADWVTIPDLNADPYPIYERLRAEGGVHWVPQVNRYLITSYDAVHETELDQEIFSANEKNSLQIRAMGHSMLRRDDPEHLVERKAWQPALRPSVVKRVWHSAFERLAEARLEEFIAKGPGADLIWDFAAPYSGDALREILGLHNATWQDLNRWSQGLIDATGNYADDPEVWARGEQAFNEVDDALDEMLAWHAKRPNESLISQLLLMRDYGMPLERIRANMKMTIGGGMNEPRDAIGIATWGLLNHPDQRDAVLADPSLWPVVFDEALRWISPIGMYSRQVTRDTDLCGVRLPEGARLGICLLSANRDERVWERAGEFDIRREVKPHLAFGKGVHACLGAWVARAEVADVALPMLFRRLPDLGLVADDPAEISGWVFRGFTKLPVTWSNAGTAPGKKNEPEASAPRIAVVGSGPAGSFSAQALGRSFPAAEVDVFDAMPVPYGLVRYGVAADHQGTKTVTHQFDRLFLDGAARFHGNVRLGEDLSLDQLREGFDAVVLATGLGADAVLEVPGAELPGVIGAGRITRLLNSHPDETDRIDLGAELVVVGNGNVAIDIVRLLSRDEQGFEGSDLDDELRRGLVSDLRTIHVVGRSAIEAAKFDPVMVREVADIAGVRHVVHGLDAISVEAGKDARIDAVRALAASDNGPERVRVEWWFGLTPKEITGTGRVASVVLAGEAGEVEIPAESVITAIGFAADESTPVVPGAHPDGRVEPGLYVAGWLRRGPRGTIPDQRIDAALLARAVAEDIASGTLELGRPGLEKLEGASDFDGWRRIDQREKLHAAPGRVRAKLRSVDEMLRTARDVDVPLPEAPGGGADGEGWGVPVTVLFATESGGAELVADELARLIGGGTSVVDLAETTPDQLNRYHHHVVVCSTYGDGEVPTSARAFHESLRSGRFDLSGVRYSMFGMGDRSYAKTYSRGSELIDEALAASGASRVGEYGRHDAGTPIAAADAARDWVVGIHAEALSATR